MLSQIFLMPLCLKIISKLKILEVFSDAHINAFSDTLFLV